MPTPPFADADGTIAVRVGRLLDVESGSLVPERTVHIRDGRVDGDRRARRRRAGRRAADRPRRADGPPRPHRHPQPPDRRGPDGRRPGDDDVGGPGRAARRRPRAPNGRGRVHQRARPRPVPRVRRPRAARRDQRGRRRGPADAGCRRVHHRAMGRRRRRRPRPRHPAAGGPPLRRRHVAGRGARARAPAADRRCRRHQVHRDRRGAHARRRSRRARAVRGRAADGGRGGRLLREVRRRARAFVRGRPAGDPGRGPLRRARVDDRRRHDRDAGRYGHLLLGRPVRRGVGARERRGRAMAGRVDGQARVVAGDGHRGHAQGRRAGAFASSTGPTAAYTRTTSSRSSSPGTCGAG